MYCKYCGSALEENAAFCPMCGKPICEIQQNNTMANVSKGMPIVAFALGIISIVVWLIPLIGFPVTVAGLILGIAGRKKGGKGFATAGIVLCIIGLVFTAANTAVRAYMGADRLLWLGQGLDSKKDEAPILHGNLVLKNEAGEIIITIDDIKSAEPVFSGIGADSQDYCVNIYFTEDGTEKFAQATREAAKNQEQIYIFVDEKLVAAPRVVCEIATGAAYINGLSSFDEAADLASKITGD